MTTNTTNDIIWAFGPRSRYAHAYPGNTIETGVPLCGIQCTPNLVSEDFNPDDPEMRKVACPDCMARLTFAKHFKPISELSAKKPKSEQK